MNFYSLHFSEEENYSFHYFGPHFEKPQFVLKFRMESLRGNSSQFLKYSESVTRNWYSFQVGEQLAEVLLRRAHGNRPITLIGFSLGARVIFHCLTAMTKRSTCYGKFL